MKRRPRLSRAEWKGIIWWRLPVAIILTFWLHGRNYGFGWSGIASLEFWVMLVVNVLVIGYFGGKAFGRYVFDRSGGS